MLGQPCLQLSLGGIGEMDACPGKAQADVVGVFTLFILMVE